MPSKRLWRSALIITTNNQQPKTATTTNLSNNNNKTQKKLYHLFNTIERGCLTFMQVTHTIPCYRLKKGERKQQQQQQQKKRLLNKILIRRLLLPFFTNRPCTYVCMYVYNNEGLQISFKLLSHTHNISCHVYFKFMCV